MGPFRKHKIQVRKRAEGRQGRRWMCTMVLWNRFDRHGNKLNLAAVLRD